MPFSAAEIDHLGGPEARGPLVLVVDDNEQNLRLACDVLRAADFRAIGAAGGAEAIALATECLPDVVLMDIRLPDLDGTEVARILAGDPRTASIPVVALSSLRLGGDDEWLRAAGFAGVLEKPISVGEFPEQVRRYCRAVGG